MRSRRREPTARSARPRPAKPPPTKLAVPIPTFWNASALWPATHGRGPLQDLGRRLRGIGGGAARRHGRQDFDSAWAEGAALSSEEAIAYAQRGRGQRKRPASGWGSLTPTERDVVRLVSEGLANKRHRRKAFRLTTHRANPPHPRLHQAGPYLTRTARPGSGPPQLSVDARSTRFR